MKIPNKTKRLFQEIALLLAPPPDLTVSEWADGYRKLSSEASAEPGQWRTDRAPYQRGIMDAINDIDVETVVVQSSAQVGKTEFLLNMIGYHIDNDPAPIMLVQPTLDMAQAFSKDRLAPMLRDTPAIRGKVKDVRSRDSGNTLLHKVFPGGHITLAGANSPASLASRPIRIVLGDEVDRYPVSAGVEGDPVMLVSKRTNTFWNRKKIWVSTPTTKGTSRIEALYLGSSMEQWCVPCPSCGEHQPFSWAQIKFDYDKETQMCTKAEHACRSCGALHPKQDWHQEDGKWIARKPNAKTRGFHLNEFASPWKQWETIVEEFHTAKLGGQETQKVWTNTSLGETWEEEGEQIEDEQLMKRLEGYKHGVPNQVKVLTAAVDVQDDRFEIEIVGWGAGKESWGIRYDKLYGDLKQQDIWRQLDEYLSRSWSNAEGKKFVPAITCIDSGGHFTTEVYRFCKPREARRIYAIKGKGAQDGEYVPFLNGSKRTPREKTVLFNLGVDEGKAKVVSRLQVVAEGPGYCHFPIDRGYNQDYFKGLTAEIMVTRYRLGVGYKVWKKVRDRNEPLDLRVYNTAALEILNPNLDEDRSTGPPAAVQRSKRRVISKGL